MKVTIRKMLYLFAVLFHALLPLSLVSRIKRAALLFYTSWLSKNFASFGSNSTVLGRITVIGPEYVSIGGNVRIGKGAVITAWKSYLNVEYTPMIAIGENCNIGEYCHISAIDKITIGKNVLMGRWITIVDNSHGDLTPRSINVPPGDRLLYSRGSVTIGNNVWLGDKVTILPGVSIGENSIIGANSVVSKTVPSNCVVVGGEMRIIRQFS